MLSHLDIFTWLETIVDNQSDLAIADDDNWLRRLFKRVYESIFAGNTFPVSSVDYLPELQTSVVFMLHPRIRSHQSSAPANTDYMSALHLDYNLGSHYPTEPEAIKATRNAIFSMIRIWLNFPNDATVYNKGEIIQMIHRSFQSPAIFLLPAVWQAYCTPQTSCTAPRRNRSRVPLSSSDLDALELSLEKLPFANQTHPDHQAYRATLTELEHLTVRFREVIIQKSTLHKTMPRVQTQRNTQSRASGNAAGGSSAPSGGSSVPIEQSTLMKPFLDFLQESAALTKAGQEPTTDAQKRIASDKDFFLAWREHAPSRMHINNPDGPFAPERVLTRAGIFSILIFRAVTFNAPACQDHPTGYFSTLDAWMDYYHTNEYKGNNFFCNPRAYGSPTNGRGPMLAAKLWESSAVLLQKLNETKSFKDVWDHIKGGKDSSGAMLYPTMGALIAYLVCVDLTYAGVLDRPGVAQMGASVSELAKGARTGLENLNLITPDASKTQVDNAFQALYHYLEANFAFEGLQLDVFVVEHGLCKYKRIYGGKAKKSGEATKSRRVNNKGGSSLALGVKVSKRASKKK